MICLILAAGFAVFAIVTILQDTAGPADIFQRFRLWLKVDLEVYDDGPAFISYERDAEPDGFLAKLYGCFWCLSTWVALALCVWYLLAGRMAWLDLPIVWFGVVGVASLCHSYYQRA